MSHSILTVEECRAKIRQMRSDNRVIYARDRFGKRVIPAPPFLHRVANADDLRLNQLHRTDEPEHPFIEAMVLWTYAGGLAVLVVGLLAWAGV